MKIALVTPASARSRAGNRSTALRWARILRSLGHTVSVSTDYQGGRSELMIALHAWRSAAAIETFHKRWPERPLIVALTGTDIYRFIFSDPAPVLRSLAAADRLVVLHARACETLPDEAREKVRLIYQSSAAPAVVRKVARERFDVCVVGHLRAEKDPLCTARASRLLPAESRLRVHHYGRAHEPQEAADALAEQAANPRYRWHGEIPYWKLRRVYASSRLMVLSSRMEGGANVISEAVCAGLPILASDIPGNRGLLGEDYPGYFPLEDARSLSALLWCAEHEPGFLAQLAAACAARAPLFTPERETLAWAELLAELN